MATHRYLRIPGKRLILTQKMVEDAVENTQSNAAAARWLGVSYNTYKKYSKIYGLFDGHLNPDGVGISRPQIKSKFSLDDILEGKYPDYPPRTLKSRMISNGYIEEECSVCGWNEERITDERVCLRIDYIDGDHSNKKFENLRLLCPNCYFTNVGNFIGAKQFCQ